MPAESITPEDLGAYKWVLRATGKEDEVVVFRVSTIRTRGGKVDWDIYDSVCYDPGKEQVKTAFFINPDYFNMNKEGDAEWRFQALGGAGSILGKFNGCSSGGGSAYIIFKRENGFETKKVFEVFIMKSVDAQKSYPQIPEFASDRSWGWAVSHEGGQGPPVLEEIKYPTE